MVSGDDASVSNSNKNLSRRAAKKARRKQEKTKKKLKALETYLPDVNNGSYNNLVEDATVSNAPSVGGKAARARLARRKNSGTVADVHSVSNGTEWAQHRPQGGAPILSQILPHHIKVVEYLESKEQEMRIKGRGIHMKERMEVKVDCHGTMDIASHDTPPGETNENELCNLSRLYLGGNFSRYSLSSLAVPPRASSLSTILHLDLSRNELWDITTDALEQLSATLITLDISRNWFESLPESIGVLLELKELRASHNLLKPNALRLDLLTSNMKQLEIIDLRFNQKCGRRSLLESLQSTVGNGVELKLTVTYPPPPADPSTVKDRVGASPAVRDAKLLRSQLEPWSTMALRRRLVADFGEERSEDGKSWADPDISRGHVMDRLLQMYQLEAVSKGDSQSCHDDNGRAVVYLSGKLVEKSIRDRLLDALKEFWSTTSLVGTRERPSICAENYMILCSPSTFEAGSQKAAKAACKLKKHELLWELAFEAINSVDPIYASKYTAVALTHNFSGSPHIDKQNLGAFYGFSVGGFDEGTGRIMVECSARVVAAVNTKNRMAKVDGRFPHWVGPYDRTADRYSLIYYRTEGEVDLIGPAVFDVPTEKASAPQGNSHEVVM